TQPELGPDAELALPEGRIRVQQRPGGPEVRRLALPRWLPQHRPERSAGVRPVDAHGGGGPAGGPAPGSAARSPRTGPEGETARAADVEVHLGAIDPSDGVQPEVAAHQRVPEPGLVEPGLVLEVAP